MDLSWETTTAEKQYNVIKLENNNKVEPFNVDQVCKQLEDWTEPSIFVSRVATVKVAIHTHGSAQWIK